MTNEYYTIYQTVSHFMFTNVYVLQKCLPYIQISRFTLLVDNNILKSPVCRLYRLLYIGYYIPSLNIFVIKTILRNVKTKKKICLKRYFCFFFLCVFNHHNLKYIIRFKYSIKMHSITI